MRKSVVDLVRALSAGSRQLAAPRAGLTAPLSCKNPGAGNDPGSSTVAVIEGHVANRRNYLFTSESVSEGHPDKVCDRISDAVVDLYLAADPHSRVAIETLVTTNRIVLAGEVRGPESVTRR